MIKHFCDICEKEMKYNASFVVVLKDVTAYNRSELNVCKKCFDEISAVVQSMFVGDKRCL